MTAITSATPTTRTRPAYAGDLGLFWHQVRFEQKAFWRNRPRAFFSVALPLLFLVVFNAINGSHRISELGGITYATWFVPGILAYGLIMATFTNLAVSVVAARDAGVLKRVRGTGLPTWAFLAGKVTSTLVTAAALVAATLGLGVAAYGVDLRMDTLPALVAMVVLGAVCFTSLGLAASALIPNADAAPALLNAIVLPLTFISGIWMVLTGAPAWLRLVADLFPVHALAHGLQHAFHPGSAAPGFVAADLLTLAAWTVVGIVAAARWFRWQR